MPQLRGTNNVVTICHYSACLERNMRVSIFAALACLPSLAAAQDLEAIRRDCPACYAEISSGRMTTDFRPVKREPTLASTTDAWLPVSCVSDRRVVASPFRDDRAWMPAPITFSEARPVRAVVSRSAGRVGRVIRFCLRPFKFLRRARACR